MSVTTPDLIQAQPAFPVPTRETFIEALRRMLEAAWAQEQAARSALVAKAEGK